MTRVIPVRADSLELIAEWVMHHPDAPTEIAAVAERLLRAVHAPSIEDVARVVEASDA